MKKVIVMPTWFLAAFIVFFLSTSAEAQMVTAQNPSSVVSAVQSAGYKALLKRDSDGTPSISSSASGMKFVIFFFGCKEGENCKTIQFFSGITEANNASLKKMNEWNAGHRFTRAYLAEDGTTARIEMDLNLDKGGISSSLFSDNLALWDGSLAAFFEFIK
jgi:hypothetical protein